MNAKNTIAARYSLFVAAALTALSLFAGGCATETARSGVAAVDCYTDADCAQGSYCGAEDTCETACDPSAEDQCGGGFSCNDDWFCEEDVASFDDGETDDQASAIDAD